MTKKSALPAKQSFGAEGERIAEKYLKSQGYGIVRRNFKTRTGEIDLIARKKEWVVFVEVKTRKHTALGYPEEAVDRKKRQKIIVAAEAFIQKYDDKKVQYRFDVIAILKTASGKTVISHLPGAFEQGE